MPLTYQSQLHASEAAKEPANWVAAAAASYTFLLSDYDTSAYVRVCSSVRLGHLNFSSLFGPALARRTLRQSWVHAKLVSVEQATWTNRTRARDFSFIRGEFVSPNFGAHPFQFLSTSFNEQIPMLKYFYSLPPILNAAVCICIQRLIIVRLIWSRIQSSIMYI